MGLRTPSNSRGMSRRLLRLILSTSKQPPPSPAPRSRSTPNSPPLQFAISSLLQSRNFSTTIHSPSPETLDGLIGPGEPYYNSVPPPSPEDFAFLRPSPPEAESAPSCSPSGKFSDDAVSIVDCLNSSDVEDVLSVEAERRLRQFREKLNESLVIDVLGLVKNPRLGVQFFLWAARQIGYAHSRPVYDELVKLIGIGSDRVPDELLREIGEDDREVLGRLMNVVVQKCCRSGRWNSALEELERLKNFRFKPSKLTYLALARVFLEAGRLDTAILIHREMVDACFRMDLDTLGLFAYSLCKASKWREALDLVEKEEVVPDTILYTRMISGMCEASLFDEAMDLLKRMRCDFSMPNVVTYRILLCGCLNKRQLGRCKRVLSMMMDEGCYPDHKIFHSLVHAYCKTGDYSYAYKLLKKMQTCGCQPGYVAYNILIGSICGNEELPSSALLELAENAYGEMLNGGLLLNKINVSNFARCLCGVGKFEKAYRIIHEMTSEGFVPDASTYSKVIEFLCNGMRVENAFLLFEEMKTNSVVPDVYTYSILIDGFCKAGLIAQARKWFDEMVRNGCSPNVVTYTSLIHAYLKVRNTDSANELFERMLSNGCIPNVVTYTALIDGYCKAGNTEKACQIYSRMQGQKNMPSVDRYFRDDDDDDENSTQPNVFTYGALVDGLCKAHKVKEAGDLLDAMLSDGVEPNQIVYDALIDGLCKAGKLDGAQKVFSKMSEHGYSPTEYTYGSLIDKMFKDKRLDLALKVLSKMLEDSCAPNVVIYTEMIDGLCKVGKIDEAYKLMQMMDEKGCRPNVVTYTAIIDGFGKANKIDKCIDLFNEMSQKGCAPNYVTYRVLIKHCCNVGFLDDAYCLLEEMKQTYWPVHISSYQKVIEGFSRDFLTTLDLMDVLTETNNVPIVPVYQILIDSFCKAGKLDRALELCREIPSFSDSSALAETYSLLIKSLCLASKADKAFQLFADLARQGVTLHSLVFFTPIMELIKRNQWEEALQLSYRACHTDVTLANVE